MDIWAVENYLKQIQNQWKDVEGKGQIENIIHLTETLYEKYKEPFLPVDEEYPWTYEMRDKLRLGVLQSLNQLADYWERQNNWKKVLETCQKGLEVNKTSEELFQRQMISYQNLGCRAEVITVFNQCKRELSSKLGIEPSQQTKAILDSVLKEKQSN